MNVISKLIIVAGLFSLTACQNKPTLPDPSFEFPVPPQDLMKPPEPLKTIPVR